jgi:hypothetical protein
MKQVVKEVSCQDSYQECYQESYQECYQGPQSLATAQLFDEQRLCG